MHKYLMELIGTFFLMLSIGISGDPLIVGLTLAALVYMGADVSGAHYNPSVSLAFFFMKKLKFNDFLNYLLAQIVGAFLASGFVFWFANVAYFVEPPFNTDLLQQASIEILFTFVLVYVYLVTALSRRFRNSTMIGLAIGITLVALTALGKPLSGAVFNPAISIGASAYDLIQGGKSFNSIPLYLLAPLSGALLAALLYPYFSKKSN